MARRLTLFTAADNVSGSGLYVTDGTAAGTLRIGSPSHVADAAVVGNALVFGASDSSFGPYQPWATDGTPGGTRQISMAYGTGQYADNFSTPVAAPYGRTIFGGSRSEVGQELYYTLSSSQGFGLVKDIYSGPMDGLSYYGYGSELTSLGNGFTVFSARTSGSGNELWRSDGLNATSMVKNINPSGSSDPGSFAQISYGKAVFRASSATNDAEPWVTDGTDAGTFRLQDIVSGSNGSLPGDFTALGDGRAIFTANDGGGYGLWVTDGTSPGTFRIASASTANDPVDLVQVGIGKALFAAISADHGRELWVTDGTATGTFELKDLSPGPSSSSPHGMTPLGNGLAVFTATDADHGNELWITDGTSAGTRLVKDIRPGTDGSDISSLHRAEVGKAYFSAFDGRTGYELWVTDGTAAGTKLLKDVFPGDVGSDPTVRFSWLTDPTPHDFNGDFSADILFRNASSGATIMAQLTGSHIAAPSAFTDVQLGTDWSIVSSAADFDGDGRSDILWRKVSSGSTLLTPMNGSHPFPISAYTEVQLGNDYAIAAVADFNGDSHADILFRSVASGATILTPLDGPKYASPSAYTGVQLGNDYAVAGAGDFDGDGKADILYRNVASGSTIIAFQNGAAQAKPSEYTGVQLGVDWSIAAVADFNADGKADLLFRNVSSGSTIVSLLNGAGQLAPSAYTNVQLGNAFEIAQVSDYNADGKADILFRDASSGSTLIAYLDGAAQAAPSAYTEVQLDHSWMIV